MPPQRFVVIGIGADGWDGLPEPARTILAAADLVLGAPRHLDLVPPARTGQQHRSWPSPLRSGLTDLAATEPSRRIVVLASGDPMLSGVGATLVEMFGAEQVSVYPQVSSVALARARLGWSAETTAVLRITGHGVHGDVHAVRRELAPGRRVLVLSADANTPAELAALLVDAGYGASRMVVLGELGGPAESQRETTAETFTGPVPRLNIVALELAGPLLGGWAAGLPDEAYDHDGQLTKRDVRAGALARLMPVPGQLLWDVGAGAGSVGIEWMRAHPACRAIAVEKNTVRAHRISVNAGNLGVPGLQVVGGAAPQALAGLPTPDAVFVGGGAGRPGVLAACRAALSPGGRLVVHAVTVETEALLVQCYRDHGGELTRTHLEHAAPIGSFTGWTPARTVTQWAVTLP